MSVYVFTNKYNRFNYLNFPSVISPRREILRAFDVFLKCLVYRCSSGICDIFLPRQINSWMFVEYPFPFRAVIKSFHFLFVHSRSIKTLLRSLILFCSPLCLPNLLDNHLTDYSDNKKREKSVSFVV